MEHAKLPLKMPETKKDEGPVTCLGMTFENDQKRREYFTEILRQKLPELKKIEGYPIGEDEDILALSDPPYYTACPNPFIGDFIDEWEEIRDGGTDDGTQEYVKKPFATDVSEGKGDAIYNAHSYATKVPYKAIMRYILHYTNPGDIVLDAFAGSGMVGYAAEQCDNSVILAELGYRIEDEIIKQHDGEVVSKLGKRAAILADLAPAATFIGSSYYNGPSNEEIEAKGQEILGEIKERYEWMYHTNHGDDSEAKGIIKYIVWSDVFSCPSCQQEIIFWDVAVDREAGRINDRFSCPNCLSELYKKNLDRVFETNMDPWTDSTAKMAKQVPCLISYTFNGRQFLKSPDNNDLEVLRHIDREPISQLFPILELPDGYNTAQPRKSHGIKYVHQFYTRRNLFLLAELFSRCTTNPLKFLFTGMLTRSSKQARFCRKLLPRRWRMGWN